MLGACEKASFSAGAFLSAHSDGEIEGLAAVAARRGGPHEVTELVVNYGPGFALPGSTAMCDMEWRELSNKAKAHVAEYLADNIPGVTAEEVNDLFREAEQSYLKGVLGVEERPLVSIDFKGDPRSAIIDALSTMVVDGTQLKVLAWYDNEMGYVHRMMELCQKVAHSLQATP